nr:PREDICTED: uncharacterized protein LOC102365633 [Latimeria chalumnae]|eukprot:XP_014353347.1 PREDICTED: uncharacterized protein LOC102365633 [Latimeria chalumnae]
MTETSFDKDTTLSRLVAVKQLFEAFSNRSMAYSFNHVVGLITFGGSAKFIHNFCNDFERFVNIVRDLHAVGNTPLYDALSLGVDQLEEIKRTFPECRLRILCLTDGNDVGSKCKPVETAIRLLKANIVVDSVIVGEVVNTVLHSISNATGGCCFKPKTLEDALKIFEMETVLSLEGRKLKHKYSAEALKTVEDLRNILKNCAYDEKPEDKIPVEVSEKVLPVHIFVTKSKKEQKKCNSMDKGIQIQTRILQELRELHCLPHPCFKVYPSESNIYFWQILMMGPTDSPYENGVFHLYCKFEQEYPVKPPVLRFSTPIYHCNINSVGRICHNILDRNYSARTSMKEILTAVFGLLMMPEADDPLDSVLAEQYLTKKHVYLEEAKKYTATHANTKMEDMEKKLLGSAIEDDPVPKHLSCPLTKSLFIDPVRTPAGNVYERRAIEDHLKRNKTDPLNGKPLEPGELKPHHQMESMVKNHRRRQIQETSL